MAPQGPETADGSRKAQLSLDAPGPDFTAMLEQYCYLHRRGFSQTQLRLKRHYPSLLLADATRRSITGSQVNQPQAVSRWPLEMFDAGVNITRAGVDEDAKHTAVLKLQED